MKAIIVSIGTCRPLIAVLYIIEVDFTEWCQSWWRTRLIPANDVTVDVCENLCELMLPKMMSSYDVKMSTTNVMQWEILWYHWVSMCITDEVIGMQPCIVHAIHETIVWRKGLCWKLLFEKTADREASIGACLQKAISSTTKKIGRQMDGEKSSDFLLACC